MGWRRQIRVLYQHMFIKHILRRNSSSATSCTETDPFPFPFLLHLLCVQFLFKIDFCLKYRKSQITHKACSASSRDLSLDQRAEESHRRPRRGNLNFSNISGFHLPLSSIFYCSIFLRPSSSMIQKRCFMSRYIFNITQAKH